MTRQLQEAGQSLWWDSIPRELLASGRLRSYIEQLSVTGLTSNSTTCAWSVRTPVSKSAPTARPRWAWKTTTLTAAAQVTSSRIVIAEDHHPEGGLGSAVTDGMPGSGSGVELLAWAGIDADHIATAAHRLIAPGSFGDIQVAAAPIRTRV
jgi:transaldolase